MKKLKLTWYKIGTWKNAGIEAKWGKVNGKPYIFLRPSHTKTWCLLDKSALIHINTQVLNGSSIKEAVDNTFSLIDIFSIPVMEKTK